MSVALGSLIFSETRRPSGPAGMVSISSDALVSANSNRGAGSVVGEVQLFGSPITAKVVLHDHRTRRVISSSASDTTGFFAFRNLPIGTRYFVAAKDPTGVYEDDISGPHDAK